VLAIAYVPGPGTATPPFEVNGLYFSLPKEKFAEAVYTALASCL